MEIWSKCDICGRDIPVGELCYGLKKGNCICKNCCTGFENCTFTLAPMPTLTPPNEPLISGFDVIDTKTGEYPDLWEIALKEDWANGLMYCDMEGFAIEEDGTLLLLDECGKQAYCPEGRFKIVPRPPEGEEDTQ